MSAFGRRYNLDASSRLPIQHCRRSQDSDHTSFPLSLLFSRAPIDSRRESHQFRQSSYTLPLLDANATLTSKPRLQEPKRKAPRAQFPRSVPRSQSTVNLHNPVSALPPAHSI
ncbi:uncharacterized protein CC84DRAFT_491566 [Paraphaeosphaeria sporulosa]|uniref:Uncharacterized protein n=1 Tax=Paraphaeosphaeria sporulosa TaxID=1460663 RepID=A0A177CUH9_9PLEO|nr:uncharacterized protein CC84DRAFT_491566 [Paraphaeosphaeria sporulosa]OAG10668.1 hypothetical protein CC84DRAFT_491566 [Paraphaeosphaeria sporulosa]